MMLCRYVLITPLHNKEWGSSILVNRGWVPSTWKTDPQLRARCQPSGKVWSVPQLTFPQH